MLRGKEILNRLEGIKNEISDIKEGMSNLSRRMDFQQIYIDELKKDTYSTMSKVKKLEDIVGAGDYEYVTKLEKKKEVEKK